jgi:hypothetical protein
MFDGFRRPHHPAAQQPEELEAPKATRSKRLDWFSKTLDGRPCPIDDRLSVLVANSRPSIPTTPDLQREVFNEVQPSFH